MSRKRQRIWSRNRNRNRELAEKIQKAIGEIELMNGKAHNFVKVATIMRRKTYDPTEHQAELLRWIKNRGFVEDEITLGMHFGKLGGLMARGLVTRTKKDGVEGVVAV